MSARCLTAAVTRIRFLQVDSLLGSTRLNNLEFPRVIYLLHSTTNDLSQKPQGRIQFPPKTYCATHQKSRNLLQPQTNFPAKMIKSRGFCVYLNFFKFVPFLGDCSCAASVIGGLNSPPCLLNRAQRENVFQLVYLIGKGEYIDPW